MLDWTGAPCIDTLVIPCGSESPITIVFLVSGEIKDADVICSASASSLTLRDASDVEVNAGIQILWCL